LLQVGATRYTESMPSPAHETLIQVLAQAPSLLGELARKAGSASLTGTFEVVDSALRLASPAEVRPDLVLQSGAR
jgi:hypothetical protein